MCRPGLLGREASPCRGDCEGGWGDCERPAHFSCDPKTALESKVYFLSVRGFTAPRYVLLALRKPSLRVGGQPDASNKCDTRTRWKGSVLTHRHPQSRATQSLLVKRGGPCHLLVSPLSCPLRPKAARRPSRDTSSPPCASPCPSSLLSPVLRPPRTDRFTAHSEGKTPFSLGERGRRRMLRPVWEYGRGNYFYPVAQETEASCRPVGGGGGGAPSRRRLQALAVARPCCLGQLRRARTDTLVAKGGGVCPATRRRQSAAGATAGNRQATGPRGGGGEDAGRTRGEGDTFYSSSLGTEASSRVIFINRVCPHRRSPTKGDSPKLHCDGQLSAATALPRDS